MLDSIEKTVADEWVSSLQKEIGILQSSVMLKDIVISKLNEKLIQLDIDKRYLESKLEEKSKTVEEFRLATRKKK
jgi:hypothetical protein